MVAMIIMRSALIVISRFVDGILIWQKHSDKEVYWQENLAVILALGALSMIIFGGEEKDFKFFESTAMMVTMGFYIVPYGIRLYIMSLSKSKGKLNVEEKAFFGIEQVFAAITVVVLSTFVIMLVLKGGWQAEQAVSFANGFSNPSLLGIAVGIPFGIAAFPSVFLYLYKGGTATFNTTINRLTSLVAGMTASLAFSLIFSLPYDKAHQWYAMIVIFIAIGFLGWAGKRREIAKQEKARLATAG